MRRSMDMTRTDILPDCTNCISEYDCDLKKAKPCAEWRPDLDYRRMMESCRGREKKTDEKD